MDHTCLDADRGRCRARCGLESAKPGLSCVWRRQRHRTPLGCSGAMEISQSTRPARDRTSGHAPHWNTPFGSGSLHSHRRCNIFARLPRAADVSCGHCSASRRGRRHAMAGASQATVVCDHGEFRPARRCDSVQHVRIPFSDRFGGTAFACSVPLDLGGPRRGARALPADRMGRARGASGQTLRVLLRGHERRWLMLRKELHLLP
jgi:hypothetical protein